MDDKLCPKTEKCPLFQGEMLASKKAQEIYMNLYCKGGEEGRMNCKRYLVAIKNLKPPIDLMPNDERDINELINKLS